jgi:hypothetical protein
MFVERKVRYSALFTNLVGWHTGAVSFPLSDDILVQLACPLSDIMFCFTTGITNLLKAEIPILYSTTISQQTLATPSCISLAQNSPNFFA